MVGQALDSFDYSVHSNHSINVRKGKTFLITIFAPDVIRLSFFSQCLDTETAWKSISCEEETEQTTSTSEEETEVTTEEEETFAAENKFVAACEKTLHTPLQGCLVFVDWWNGCVCE
jgi:hypothetical protein